MRLPTAINYGASDCSARSSISFLVACSSIELRISEPAQKLSFSCAVSDCFSSTMYVGSVRILILLSGVFI